MSAKDRNRIIRDLQNDEELVTMDIYHKDGQTTCIVAAILDDVPGYDDRYCALLPIDENGEYSPDNAWFYRYYADDAKPDEEPRIESVENDAELEAVIDRYEEFRDDLAFEELFEEEDD